jgi:hypothetical protein
MLPAWLKNRNAATLPREPPDTDRDNPTRAVRGLLGAPLGTARLDRRLARRRVRPFSSSPRSGGSNPDRRYRRPSKSIGRLRVGRISTSGPAARRPRALSARAFVGEISTRRPASVPGGRALNPSDQIAETDPLANSTMHYPSSPPSKPSCRVIPLLDHNGA